MTRTLQERPGLPGSARNDPPPEPVGFLSAYPGYQSTAVLDRLRATESRCRQFLEGGADGGAIWPGHGGHQG